MKCQNCDYENKDNAKFCTKCGAQLIQETPQAPVQKESDNSKFAIIALVVVIIVLVAAIGYFAYTSNTNSVGNGDSSVQQAQSSDDAQKTQEKSSSQSDSSSKTHEVDSKSWEVIGSYSGSGSGSKTIDVPSGKIKVKLSAYPIKNYATNHLYVKGSNGESGGVDWGSKSAVETRSDSFEYESSSSQTFTIDYYETVSWEVTFYRYQ